MSLVKAPLNLRSAVRSLEGLGNINVTGQWHLIGQKWALPIEITIHPRGSIVDGVTAWFVAADPIYPLGDVKIYPSKIGGITATFQHQAFNGEGDKDQPWRSGKLCLDSSIGFAGRDVNEHEPFNATGIHSRLTWHVRRAAQWLDAAADTTLVSEGESYELPEYPSTNGGLTTLAHSENTQTFTAWKSNSETYGLVELIRLSSRQENVLLTKRFLKLNGNTVLDCAWGRQIDKENVDLGGWLRLPSSPIIQPWKAPTTWEELWEACRSLGIEKANPFWRIVNKLRDGKEHLLLIGFPMPQSIGGELVQLHWQPIALPSLSHGKVSRPGFRERNDPKVHQLFDHNTVLRGSEPINWQKSENWSVESLVSRGGLPIDLRNCKVTLLGCGTFGSSVAELLVRAGLQQIVLVDEQTLEAANLCRHTLLLSDIKQPKATRLAERLTLINPHVQAIAIADGYPMRDEEHLKLVSNSQLVIDCTANDSVIRHLSKQVWKQKTAFVSLWLGMYAKRLYCFCANETSFPLIKFNSLTQPWLRKEQEEYPHEEFPRDGVGCWHPVFPARIDDVWSFACIAVKSIEFFMNRMEKVTKLTVYEQQSDVDGFVGVTRVMEGQSDA